MKRPIRLTERDLSRIVRRLINEIDDNTQVYSDFDSDKTGVIHNDGPKETNVEPKPKYNYRAPQGYRHDYLYDKGYIKNKYAVQFGEIHQLMVSKYGSEPNIRDIVKECLLLSKRGTYSPLMLEEYIFTQTDDKPKSGREHYFTQEYE
jgi:hypothetical protein